MRGTKTKQAIAACLCSFFFLFLLSKWQYSREIDQMSRDALAKYNQMVNPDGGSKRLYPVLMTAYGQPQYLKRSLEALSNCSNIEEVDLFIFLFIFFKTLIYFVDSPYCFSRW